MVINQIKKWTLWGTFSMVILKVSFTHSGKINGYMFGDYYYIVENHNKGLEDENGFKVRGIYFTCDQTLNENFEVRFRLDMNSAGDFSCQTKLEPFVKKIYLKW